MSSDRARSISSLGSYPLGGAITLDLEDLAGDLVDRKIVSSSKKTQGT